MRQNKGITLISLIIYIIVFTSVIGTVAMITNYFTKNSEQTIISSKAPEQYAELTSYLVKDMESDKIKNIRVKAQNILDISFTDELRHIYIYGNNELYYVLINKDDVVEKKIRVCKNVSVCNFSKDDSNLNISIKINNIIYNNKYAIKISDTD